MTIIRPHSMPRFWWLVPWAYARQLHRTANALRALSDRLDDALGIQGRIIDDQSEEIRKLRQQVAALNDAIIRGAIVPDAKEVQS